MASESVCGWVGFLLDWGGGASDALDNLCSPPTTLGGGGNGTTQTFVFSVNPPRPAAARLLASEGAIPSRRRSRSTVGSLAVQFQCSLGPKSMRDLGQPW